MSSKKVAILQIGVALLFALAILLSSYFIDSSEQSQTVTTILIGIWFVPFSYLVKMKSKNRKTTCC
jgi:hypothetical protein